MEWNTELTTDRGDPFTYKDREMMTTSIGLMQFGFVVNSAQSFFLIPLPYSCNFMCCVIVHTFLYLLFTCIKCHKSSGEIRMNQIGYSSNLRTQRYIGTRNNGASVLSRDLTSH